MSAPATTIDEVLDVLDAIIDETIENNDASGLFAYIYRRTTAEIKAAIEEGKFADPAGMEKFDVYFANLYITAYRDYRAGKPVTQAWKTAFDYSSENLTVLQHVILGMNAHINLDLGITAGTVATGDEIAAIETDFMAVNDVLERIVEELQQRISRVSGVFFLFTLIGGRKDDAVIGWSIRKARQASWNFAKKIAYLEGDAKAEAIEKKDQQIAALSEKVASPPGKILAYGLSFIRFFEIKDIKRVIVKLRAAD